MKREAVLRALKAAGSTNDRQAWTRLYVENRVSFTVANRLWREGVQWAEFIRRRDAKVTDCGVGS